ncbi:DUF7552 domain-containing protein [Salinigranum marinum]|uniref:DUF7552 domain-containing protein n=1 Tax=Salinigranum marinum TaxID=1515595 RepID=UPI002989FE92|nr:hypothetical protein [Salinigranum marinum]
MRRGTLRRLRHAIDAIASPNGDYLVRCARTGVRPFPVSGRRFRSRNHAVVAARLATRFRGRLRRYDPDTAVYDLVVCDAGAHERGPTDRQREPTAASNGGRR